MSAYLGHNKNNPRKDKTLQGKSSDSDKHSAAKQSSNVSKESLANKPEIYAYIDGANLYNGVRDQGWLLDYSRFRIWLRDKLEVTKAQIFIGLDTRQSTLYRRLQEL